MRELQLVGVGQLEIVQLYQTKTHEGTTTHSCHTFILSPLYQTKTHEGTTTRG